MQVIIPRTGKASLALYTCVFILCLLPNLHAKKPPLPTPKIVFHCMDWIKDTLPSYDLGFVRNNPLTIGNPTVFASPKGLEASPQVLFNAAWYSRTGAGVCDLEPAEVMIDSIRNLGFVYAIVEGVAGSPTPDLRWSDELVYYSCAEMQQNGGIYAKILRKWTATYQTLQKDTIQEILFIRPKLDEFVFGVNNGEIIPENFDQIITYQACSGDKSLIQKKDVTPYIKSYFSTDLNPRWAFIDEANTRYGIEIKNQDFPTCGSRGLRTHRSIYVFDSCQGRYIDTFLVIIKIGDYQAPKFIKSQELKEIHLNSSMNKATFGINRSELAARFGIQIEECFLAGISARVEIKDRYVDGVLVAENVWDEVPKAVSFGSVSLPIGHYRLHLTAIDPCFNLSQDSFEFVVKNELGAIPICSNGFSIESLLSDGQGGGQFIVKAADFVGAPLYDLNGQGPDTLDGKKLITHYSINRIGEGVDSSQRELKLTCNDAGKVILVELHAWNKKGQDGFCISYVEVQNKNMICFIGVGGPSINGTIAFQNVGVQNVKVDLNGLHHSSSFKTTKTGSFTFLSLNRADYYKVVPNLDENPLNGVSTFDIVLIQKHILGIQVLNSPYKMIAADVNNSKSITTLDLIQLRKLILGIDTNFPNNRSWRFVRDNYVFPNPNDPWAGVFPEIAEVLTAVSPSNLINFIAIKIGDVNGNAKVNDSQ